MSTFGAVLALEEPHSEPLHDQASCRCKPHQTGLAYQGACWIGCQPACRSTAVTAAQREATELQKERAGWQKTQRNLQAQVTHVCR